MTSTAITAVIVGVVGIGCHAAATPPPRETPPTDAAPPPVAPSAMAGDAEPAEDGELVTDGTTVAVEVGGAEIASEHRAVYRDSQDRVRVRAIALRELRANEGSPIQLALGDHVSFGPWDVRWVAVRGGYVRLQGRYQQNAIEEWGSSDDVRVATHELQTRDQLFTFEVRITAAQGRLDRADGRVEITARAVERAPSAKFGQTLSPGVFVFPGGLRLHVEKLHECDFDVSAPCPFGGAYRAYAALDQRTEHVELKSKLTKILGHTLELGRGTFVVRR